MQQIRKQIRIVTHKTTNMKTNSIIRKAIVAISALYIILAILCFWFFDFGKFETALLIAVSFSWYRFSRLFFNEQVIDELNKD